MFYNLLLLFVYQYYLYINILLKGIFLDRNFIEKIMQMCRMINTGLSALECFIYKADLEYNFQRMELSIASFKMLSLILEPNFIDYVMLAFLYFVISFDI